MAAARFNSDEEALAFLVGGPVGDPQLDIAPEAGSPMLDAVEAPMPGAIEPEAARLLAAQTPLEPPLPEDEPLPPVEVVTGPEAAAKFASDDEAMAFLRAAEAPAPGKFATDDDAMAFLRAAESPGAGAFPETPRAATTAMPVAGQKRPGEAEPPMFTGKDAAFRFTGAMVADPQTGQISPGTGTVLLDHSSPERLTQGIEEAWRAGVLEGKQYAALREKAADVYRVVEERKQLEKKAALDPRLASALYGAGRGGAATLGAVAGAEALGPLGTPLGLPGVAVMGTAGAIGGAILGPKAFDKMYEALGQADGGPAKGRTGELDAAMSGERPAFSRDVLAEQVQRHENEFDLVLQSAGLYPEWKQGAETGMAALAVPVSLAQGARGLAATAAGPGGIPAAAKQAAAAAGLGAGAGAVAYPINAAVEGEAMTPGGFAQAAGAGALMGGFFINGRTVGAAEVLAAAQKARTGMPLTAEEAQIMKAAAGPVRDTVNFVDAQGGIKPKIDVEVPVTSVAGMMPAAGRARVQAEYYMPPKLPAGAVARTRALMAENPRPPVQEAPVNVLPPGERALVTPPADMPAPAQLSPDAYIAAMAGARGIDTGFNPEAETALLAEHFDFVKRAVDAGQPVSAAALDAYEMRVPYYLRQPAEEGAGLAVYDQAAYDEYAAYVAGRESDAFDEAAAGGTDLLDAIAKSGGLPAKGSSKIYQYEGELQRLRDAARGGKFIGLKGVFAGKLFRKDARDMDVLIKNLQGYGFKIETPRDLFDLLEKRLATGQPIYAYGTAEEYEVRAGRRKPQAEDPGQRTLFAEQEMPFNLAGQTDTTSLTPQEMQARMLEAERAAEAERLQGDLFGEKSGARRVEETVDADAATREGSGDGIPGAIPQRTEGGMGGSGEGQGAQPVSDSEALRYLESDTRLGIPAEKLFDGISYDPARRWGLHELMLQLRGGGWEPWKQEVQPPIYLRGYATHKAAYDKAAEIATRTHREVVDKIKAHYPDHYGKPDRMIPATPEARELFTDETGKVHLITGGPGYETMAGEPLEPGEAMFGTGGGAQVPQAPAGQAPAQVPGWVTEAGETSEGRRLIKGIANFRPGQQWGYASIVQFLNKAVHMEMRRSMSQTSRTHPAHYRTGNLIEYTRETRSQINFHEAGHGLEEMLRARAPGWIDNFKTELLALTKRKGSMASDPPGGTAEMKMQYRLGEGVAEWMRLLVVDPPAVEGMAFSRAVGPMAEKYYPRLAATLRDGARAMHRFQTADVADRINMINAVPTRPPSANELVGALVRGVESLGNYVASGAPITRLARNLFRETVKNRKETGMSYKQALAKARAVRTQANDVVNAYTSILGIPAEVQLAISGTGASKGLRAMDDKGNYQYFTKWTWNDLRNRVPRQHAALFDQAAWAMESLERWQHGRMEYTGMRDGLSPDDLKAVVKRAMDLIPGFGQMFAEQQNFHHSVLELKEFGHLLSADERRRIQNKRPTYWPMPRELDMAGMRGGKSGGDIRAGVYRARGSTEATRQIDEVTVERVHEAMTAIYWNRLLRIGADNMRAIAKDRSLPMSARAMAGGWMVPLKMPMEKVASLSADEVKPWVLDAVADMLAPELGFRPDPASLADKVNISWDFKDVFRPARPGDINVVGMLRDGKRQYYQIGDPAVFALFMAKSNRAKATKFLDWALGPMTENWKRIKTQGLVFAARNVARDVISQSLLNTDAIGWLPGGAHAYGIYNKFAKKYPQVMQEGLLLSRNQPTDSELMWKAKHSAIYQFLTQSLYVSQSKDPTVKFIATALNPSNILYPAWLLSDLVNLVGGKQMARFTEEIGREGAAALVLRRGGSDADALTKYWQASGPFNEHPGEADAATMVRLVPFFNPMMQGARAVLLNLTDPDPRVRGTVWARLLLLGGLASASAAMAYAAMDKRSRDRERQRTIDDRMNFASVGPFAMPFSHGPEGALMSFSYNAVMDDLLGRKDAESNSAALGLLKRIFDPTSLLNVFGPQIATIQELRANWSYYRQKNIVSPWMANLPASEQYYSTTPAFYRKLGEMFDYSPAKLQYFMQQGVATQADELIRFVESIGSSRPIQELADVPFVGRLFVRDPLGFGSQAVRNANAAEDRLRLLDTRLNAKGWSQLRDPAFDASGLGPKMQALQMQLRYLDGLRYGLRRSDDIAGLAKAAALAENWTAERNARALMTIYTQTVLVGNQDKLKVLDQAIDLLKQIPDAPPRQKAEQYLQRRF